MPTETDEEKTDRELADEVLSTVAALNTLVAKCAARGIDVRSSVGIVQAAGLPSIYGVTIVSITKTLP